MNTTKQHRLADEINSYMTINNISIETMAQLLNVEVRTFGRWLGKSLLHTGICMQVERFMQGQLPSQSPTNPPRPSRKTKLAEFRDKEKAWKNFYQANTCLQESGITEADFILNPMKYCRVRVVMHGQVKLN